MKSLYLIIVAGLCVGCTKAGQEFVQGSIRIATPVTRETGKGGKIHDGGSLLIPIRDAKGREFWIFIDHGIDSPTPGAIYLDVGPEAYPPSRIRVIDVQGFKQTVGDYDSPQVRTNGSSQ